jgi:hypothetical protein
MSIPGTSHTVVIRDCKVHDPLNTANSGRKERKLG